jgi:hypothetical protein
LNANEVGHESQYAWPPQDPTRLTQPEPEYYKASGSAFVYGNDSFNPALKPTNSALRSRHNQTQEGEVYSSGSERDNDDEPSESSSPEPYMSDYDYDNSGALGPGERMPRHNRVRQGSEGYEVRPMGSWNIVDHPEPEERERPREMPWEERGRYNVYEPAQDDDWDESDGDGDGDGEDVPLAILRNRVGHA